MDPGAGCCCGVASACSSSISWSFASSYSSSSSTPALLRTSRRSIGEGLGCNFALGRDEAIEGFVPAVLAGCGASPSGGGGGNSGGGAPSSSTVGSPESAALMAADANSKPPGAGGGAGNGLTTCDAGSVPAVRPPPVLSPPPVPFPSNSRISAIVSSFVRAGTPIGNGGTPAACAAALSLKAGSFSNSVLRAELLFALALPCELSLPCAPPVEPELTVLDVFFGVGFGELRGAAAAAAALAFCSLRHAIS